MRVHAPGSSCGLVNETDRRRWAIELLNLSFKQHAWKKFIRFDASKGRFFFSPYRNQPRRIYWHISGRRAPREVTTPHFITYVDDKGEKVRTQYGWRHQGSRANFLLLPAGLFLRLEPAYLLTKPDGKKARGGARVGPILSHWINQERNGQILRSLRFWSLVLSKTNESDSASGLAGGRDFVCADAYSTRLLTVARKRDVAGGHLDVDGVVVF